MYSYLTTFDLNELKTGDLLLFNNENNSGFFSWLSKLIKWGSHSNYTHIAMVLKNPTFVNPNLKGLFLIISPLSKVKKVKGFSYSILVTFCPSISIPNQ